MGVINVTPDSFSDGGRFLDPEAAIAQGVRLAEEGAALIDVGGESGVTGRAPVPAAVEIERVVPLVERLAGEGVAVSVDTWRAPVARAALAAGAVLINDVSGLRDPALAGAVAEAGAGVVVTHTRAAPKVKAFPRYGDIVAEVAAFLSERVALARARDVAAEGIVVDPGPDLAKTPAQTVALLRGLAALAPLGRPVLLAASRKDFIGAITGRPPRERLAGTLAAVAAGLEAGASILRVHDVPAVADFLAVRSALAGRNELGEDLRLPASLRREEPAA
jgi:dihydropteroate synthase